MTEAGDSKKYLIVEDEKSLLTAWGLKIFAWGIKTWETSAGEMRIFNLLGSDPVGRKFTQSGKSGARVVRHSTGESSQW